MPHPNPGFSRNQHWPYYLTEAAGLALFVIGTGLLSIALEHPDSGLHQALAARGIGQELRRVPLGVGMGLLVAAITYTPWGQRSGAHLNPAITLAFWQLGKISGTDALWYALAQAVGGFASVWLLKLTLFAYYSHPRIDFGTTQPGPDGPLVAFVAEFVIALVFMLALLAALHSAQLHKAAGWIGAGLLAAYVIWETPLSGMSLNPLRSLASAVAARDYTGLWLYLVASPAAMWLAAMLFQRLRQASPRRRSGAAATEPPHYPDVAAG
ncbi:aquaporin family protein [Hymenobacter oligotrophus]|uniref:Aquaporin family protein n=1 Tax=Hymenobacter oligotrophus TaxID=2319843 RepID=A0A3B7R5F5_9BACT|nr:aquaporin [Hymenobacter oligotrophus]AYA36449.1 aquaporin family protein [Hymenobacter oligotrophus]